jgi:hypothetical protein
MADDQQQPAPPAGGGTPSRGATPGQAPGTPTAPAEAPNVLVQAEPAAEGGALSADEQRQLGELLDKRDQAAAGDDAAELKVESPHSSMLHSNVLITSDWTTVPGHLVPAIETAAAAAGVTLSRKE